MNNQWSDDLRRRMENHQVSPPEGLWNDIKLAMKSTIILPKKQNKVSLWSKRISVAAASLILLFVGDYFLKENLLNPIVQENGNKHKLERESSILQINENALFVKVKEQSSILSKNSKIVVKTEVSKESLLREGKNVKNLIAKAEEAIEPKNVIIKEDNLQSNPKKVEDEKGTEKECLKEKKRVSSNKYNLFSDLSALNNSSKSSKLETNIYASNLSFNVTKKYEGYGNLSTGAIPIEMGKDDYLNENLEEEILVGNKYREVYTDIKHRQPITIGASVNYYLNGKWSLTSGLTFTILSSELSSGSDTYYYTSEQTLHNIGIPLNINYNMWKNKSVSVYLSVGGLLEKNVYGKLSTDYIIDNKLQQNKEEKISLDQLQWSLNTSAGILYNISKKIGLYVEPGVSYYFNNGSEIETIYKERPINFSLRLGLRISLIK